ncbi:TetR/AcrR family transcriptional regulator [Streptomyces sp. Amel2xE9]|uniref:TetR/AcrR family transcriptional regulator n=1 Tax=Streptomyces sp. Amel2xE9 TaxID=1157634 RepID=UPI003B63D5C7
MQLERQPEGLFADVGDEGEKDQLARRQPHVRIGGAKLASAVSANPGSVRTTALTARRGRNPRGQGEWLRGEIVGAVLRLLDELADDQVLSLRAVAREVGIAATSVYLHFADRDALVLAALEHCYADLLRAVADAESDAADPVAALRARTAVLGAWSREHPGLYEVLHESTLNRRTDMSFKEEMAKHTTAAIRRCMDAGLAPRGDAGPSPWTCARPSTAWSRSASTSPTSPAPAQPAATARPPASAVTQAPEATIQETSGRYRPQSRASPTAATGPPAPHPSPGPHPPFVPSTHPPPRESGLRPHPTGRLPPNRPGVPPLCGCGLRPRPHRPDAAKPTRRPPPLPMRPEPAPPALPGTR